MPPNLYPGNYQYTATDAEHHVDEATSLLKNASDRTTSTTSKQGRRERGHHYRSRSTRKCRVSCWVILSFLVLLGSILLGIYVVIIHSVSTLQPDIEAAQDQVQVNFEGAYYVVYQDQVTENTTFAELAQRMLPPWYEASLMAIDDDLDPMIINPSNVVPALEVLLTVRMLLDAFSPVFPKHSIWKQLKKQYKRGYEVVGDFEDLNHMSVAYREKYIPMRKQAVLDWKESFRHFQRGHNVRAFLYREADPLECTFHRSSYLFWGDLQVLPCGRDLAAASLQHLVQVQLTNAAVYWKVAKTYSTVLGNEGRAVLHNLHMELRIFLDEYDLFQNILLPNPNHGALKTLEQAQTLLDTLNEEWIAYRMVYNTEEATGNQTKEEIEQLVGEINTTWTEFKNWSLQVDLSGVIQSVLDLLDEGLEWS